MPAGANLGDASCQLVSPMMMPMMPDTNISGCSEDAPLSTCEHPEPCYTTDPESGEPLMWVPIGYMPMVFESWEDANNYMMCSQAEQEYADKDDCYPIESVIGKVWKLSKDARGCRKVQQAFDEARSIEEINAMASELTGH